MECPRCSHGLVEGSYEGVEVHKCAQCDGVLVSQRRLIPLMTALTKTLSQHVDLNQPIPSIPDMPGNVHCPQCAQQMQNFGYMGTNTIMLDRCSRDALIWIDPTELGAMAVLYARTNKRTDARQEFYQQELNAMSRRVDRLLVQRALSSGFASGAL